MQESQYGKFAASSPGAAATGNTTPSGTNNNKAKLVIPPNKKDVRKLFVGGLGRQVNDQSFAAFFEQFGTILDSVVMVDRFTKTPRGFGFVTFEDPAVALKLLSDVKNQNENGQSNKGHSSNGAGGYGNGKINIYGRMCEIKASEPKKSYSNGNGGASRGRNSVHDQNGTATGTGTGGHRLDGSGHPGQSICSSASSEAMIPHQIQFQNGAKNHGMDGTRLEIGNKAGIGTTMNAGHWNVPPPPQFYPVPMHGAAGTPMNVSADFMYYPPNPMHEFYSPYAYYPPAMVPVAYPPQYYPGHGYPIMPNNVPMEQGMMTDTSNGVAKTSHEKGTAIS